MAGVTNYPYRKICRDFGAGLCVSEMISSRGILERSDKTWKLAQFGAEEMPRSIQIFGCDADAMGEAARRLVAELGVDHVDINFGCPVPKLVRKGMGAAAVVDTDNFRRVVRAVVRAAEPVPVTLKFRLGMHEDLFTFREAGRVAEGEGCAYVALHGRTAAQMYSGKSRWQYVRELKEMLRIPVLGNGDVFEAPDALRRMEETGCDGVVIGRGCLGNPWLFRGLKAAFEGSAPPEEPGLEDRVRVIREHFDLLLRHYSDVPRLPGLLMRKFGAWYVHGLRGAAALRREFQKVRSREDLEPILARLIEENAGWQVPRRSTPPPGTEAGS
jgi:nifR3 family TIM-barrel protein